MMAHNKDHPNLQHYVAASAPSVWFLTRWGLLQWRESLQQFAACQSQLSAQGLQKGNIKRKTKRKHRIYFNIKCFLIYLFISQNFNTKNKHTEFHRFHHNQRLNTFATTTPLVYLEASFEWYKWLQIDYSQWAKNYNRRWPLLILRCPYQVAPWSHPKQGKLGLSTPHWSNSVWCL